MTKPNKLFSWLGFGKKPEADPTPVATPEQTTEKVVPAVTGSDLTADNAVAAESNITADAAATQPEVAENQTPKVVAAPTAADCHTQQNRRHHRLPRRCALEQRQRGCVRYVD